MVGKGSTELQGGFLRDCFGSGTREKQSQSAGDASEFQEGNPQNRLERFFHGEIGEDGDWFVDVLLFTEGVHGFFQRNKCARCFVHSRRLDHVFPFALEFAIVRHGFPFVPLLEFFHIGPGVGAIQVRPSMIVRILKLPLPLSLSSIASVSSSPSLM